MEIWGKLLNLNTSLITRAGPSRQSRTSLSACLLLMPHADHTKVTHKGLANIGLNTITLYHLICEKYCVEMMYCRSIFYPALSLFARS